MSTDTTALTERIARVLHEIDPVSGHGHDWGKLSDAERRFYTLKTAAVLPLIAAEVRKAQADAWDEGQASGWDEAQEQWQINGMVGDMWKHADTPNPYREQED